MLCDQLSGEFSPLYGRHTMNTTTTTHPDVPPPPDTTYLYPWDEDSGERHYWGTDRDGVIIHGFQKADGHIRTRSICVDHHMGETSAAQARQEGINLIAAADELDRLEGTR